MDTPARQDDDRSTRPPQAEAEASRRRVGRATWRRKLLFGCIATALVLLALEVALRVGGYPPWPGLRTGCTVGPLHERTNAWGVVERVRVGRYCEVEFVIKDDGYHAGHLPPPDRLAPELPSIVVVGDSWVFGTGLHPHERMDARLARCLTDAAGSGRAWRVLNLGRPGANVEPSNIREGLDRRSGLRDALLRVRRLALRSRTMTLAYDLVRPWEARRRRDRWYELQYQAANPLLKSFPERLRRMRSIAEANGAALRVVLFPHFFPDRGQNDLAEYRYSRCHDQLAALVDGEKVPFLDLLPALQAAQVDIDDLSIPGDGHPTAKFFDAVLPAIVPGLIEAQGRRR